MLGIILGNRCLPIRYQALNWGYQVAQFDVEYRIGRHMLANSILSIKLELSSGPIRYLVSNWETYVYQFDTWYRNGWHMCTKSIPSIELGLVSCQFDTEYRVETHSILNWGYMRPKYRVGAHKSPKSVLYCQIVDTLINTPMVFYFKFRVRILSFMEKLSDWNCFKHYNYRNFLYLAKLPVWHEF